MTHIDVVVERPDDGMAALLVAHFPAQVQVRLGQHAVHVQDLDRRVQGASGATGNNNAMSKCGQNRDMATNEIGYLEKSTKSSGCCQTLRLMLSSQS